MTIDRQNPPKGRGLIVLLLAFLGLTAGLCTIFALVVTAAKHDKAVLVRTDMPLGGSDTPNNLNLLEFFALCGVVLLVSARIARQWATPSNEPRQI
jgi:hypothetical protein